MDKARRRAVVLPGWLPCLLIPRLPPSLTGAPFRGSAAVRAGLVSWSRLRSGCWRRLLPDVYAAASLPETVTLRARAAALLLPSGAAVTGSSAAWLHGVDVRTRDEPLDVSLPRGAAHAPHPSLRIRRALLTAADVTLAQAVPVTTPLRTAFDFARQPDEVAGMVGLDALLHAELVTAEQVLDFAAAHPGWRGVRAVGARNRVPDGVQTAADLDQRRAAAAASTTGRPRPYSRRRRKRLELRRC